MPPTLTSLTGQVQLLPGEAQVRRERNRAYMNRLSTENLLVSHYLEAGLVSFNYRLESAHGGWDAITSDIRGTVVGHWLSAAAHLLAEAPDPALKLRADFIVAEIARCQAENGGQWAFPIPEKYLHWLKRGKRKWAPQYVCHKNMLGLLDMYQLTGSQPALDIVLKCADWFYAFTADVTREEMDEMMDREETGGMMEHWANLYALTQDPRHLELMRRYERPRLFAPLERGEDVLSNMHANATIPEVQGAARAYEVTGEERYRRIVENYWDLAVRKRGTYATGGQTCGEVWTPFGQQAARLGELNQEHCTVYNLMRLAEYLLRWSGQAEYADFYERNLYNGIFAQGHWQGSSRDILCEPRIPPSGLVAYYLPLAAGSQKKWGSELDHFWCCHCTLLQANAIFPEAIYYRAADGLRVCQYLPSTLRSEWNGVPVEVTLEADPQAGENIRILPVNREILSRPDTAVYTLKVHAERPQEFTLQLRRPDWLQTPLRVWVNGVETDWESSPDGFACLRRVWGDDEVRVSLVHRLTCWPLPDRPDMVAFLDGPLVLAGLVGEERELVGDIHDPYSLLTADNEREWQTWKSGWRTLHQPVGWRFKPLYEIGHEVYSVYFPVRAP